jgi:hypothetical protein
MNKNDPLQWLNRVTDGKAVTKCPHDPAVTVYFGHFHNSVTEVDNTADIL